MRATQGNTMTRWVDRLEGLALLGTAGLRGGRITTPAIMDASPQAGPPSGPGSLLLSERSGAPSGHRWLRIGPDPLVDLDIPTAAPEVSGTSTGVTELGSGVLVVRGPVPADELRRSASSRPELVILSNARQLLGEGEPFVQSLRHLHEAFRGCPLLWAPRVALPHRVPLLVYLGIDLLDTTEGLLQGLHGIASDESLGPDLAGKVEEAATASEYRRALATTVSAIGRGRLRELVESRLTTEPALGELLRYADRWLGPLLEERVAVVGTASLGRYVLAESLRRPEMRRFRDRLVERYRPPPSKEVLVLVPCSRTKPYRLSRSHRRFARAWEGTPRAERLHIVSVSSPIGVVPRELEDTYPARHYDIPVTGEWSQAEQDVVRQGLRHLIRDGKYRSIIVHLDPVEYDFLREVLTLDRPTVWTLGDARTTSEEALSALHSAVVEALDGVPPTPGGPLTVVREELKEIACWQFGREAAERLFRPPIRLLGRPWFQRLNDGSGTDLASWREERGLFHLTVAGAKRLDGEGAPVVEVDPRVPLTGDLFAPGVLHAHPGIRIGDSVLIQQNGALAAVGEAALPGPLMTTLGHGLAVWVRHRAGPPTDTALKGEGPEPPGPVV